MRITQNITAQNALYNIQQARARLDRLNLQAASGNTINRPGDDPIGTRQLLDLDARLSQGEQYLSNITKANVWQKMTETSLNGMFEMLSLARKEISSVTGGTSDPVIRQHAIEQFKAIKQQIIDIANTKLGGQYIFGGFETRTPPFTNADNLYHGSDDTLSIEIGVGTTIALNVKGNDLLKGTGSYGSEDVLQAFDDMIAAVTANDPVAIRNASQSIIRSSDQVFTALSEVESKIVRLDGMKNLIQSEQGALTTVYANIQTVDLAKVGVELQQGKVAFEAALSATAKISQLSLLDYLR